MFFKLIILKLMNYHNKLLAGLLKYFINIIKNYYNKIIIIIFSIIYINIINLLFLIYFKTNSFKVYKKINEEYDEILNKYLKE
jgi:hypothetical protein